MTSFSIDSRVRLADTDASGFIHYAAIFRHVEAADHEFLRSLGHAYPTIERGGVKFPRVRAECDYVSPLRFDDPVTTTVAVAKVGTSSFTLTFTIAVRAEARARARLTIVCLDEATGKSRPLPENLAESLRARIAGADTEGARG